MQFRLADALLRTLLGGAIGCYRRRLSGRGPFRGVRCTFEHCESCSAYSERMVREAPTALVALGRIRRRLQRCRHLSLYRLPDGGLGWGKDYELLNVPSDFALQRMNDVLVAEDENHATRQAVGQAAAAVLACAGSSYDSPRPDSCPRLLMRDAAAVQRALARRIWRRTALAAIAIVCGALVWASGIAALLPMALLLAALLLVVVITALPSQRLRKRLERLEILNAIEEPWPIFRRSRA